MTVELLNESAEDGETIVVSWLGPMNRAGGTSNTRRLGAPLPAVIVTQLEANENVDESTADVLVSVHTLCDKNLGGAGMGYVPGRDEVDKTHRRMLMLARYLEDVSLSNGRIATIDYVNPAGMSGWMAYEENDQIIQKIGRYQIGLSYARAP